MMSSFIFVHIFGYIISQYSLSVDEEPYFTHYITQIDRLAA